MYHICSRSESAESAKQRENQISLPGVAPLLLRKGLHLPGREALSERKNGFLSGLTQAVACPGSRCTTLSLLPARALVIPYFYDRAPYPSRIQLQITQISWNVRKRQIVLNTKNSKSGPLKKVYTFTNDPIF